MSVTWENGILKKTDRENILGKKGGVIWLTGYSGSGKSTLGFELETILHDEGYLTYVLDGDNLRHGINSDLSFSDRDRTENIRRISHIASLLEDSGILCIVCVISPYAEGRNFARSICSKFIEVFVSCPLDICIKRDVKKLYQKSLNGVIKDMTGINSNYEVPKNPEIIIDTSKNVNDCLYKLKSEVLKLLL